ncbi:MAG: alpha-glucan family phosphorylase [Ignavibacteriales bacterium]|nr:alpha-glucan family phosphorylase [Ignavibacteriales bacterium]
MGTFPRTTNDTDPLLQRLAALASNLWWAWNPEAQEIFRDLSPQVWERSHHNAVEVLREASEAELRARLRDPDFLRKVKRALNEFEDYLGNRATWASRHSLRLKGPVVYFSAEFGLHESLPIYSGGLGVLSGDHAKSASDLGIPFLGIGLFYRQGYFQQHIDPNGWQQELYPVQEPERLPLELVTLPEGGRLLNSVEIGHSTVFFQTWRLKVGRTNVYLLDTNLPENDQHFQGLTANVYGGNIDTRIGQEIILGIGGVRLLRSMKIYPAVYHMNEGHSAFLVFEMLKEKIAEGKTIEEAEVIVRSQCVFTTHTPVPAGHDRFSSEMMDHTFSRFRNAMGLSHDNMMAYGRINGTEAAEPFTMTVLALRMSRAANAVSKLHGHVSREMWQHLYPGIPIEKVPIGSVTNGVHTPGWASAKAHEFWNKRLGYDWTNKLLEPKYWKKIEQNGLASDEELWALRYSLRRDLIEFIRQRLREQYVRTGESGTSFDRVLSPDRLTICFARRFATYKRAPLIFRKLDRIIPMLINPERPAQLVFAGKAHPRDNEGKKFIQKIIEMTRHPQLQGRVVFVENYDMNVARHLVAGADVWLNNPRRPLEASGTSGMKVLIHGGLNLSIMDGWWREGFDGTNGWSIGSDESQPDLEAQDEKDFENLVTILESRVIGEYYDRDKTGIPRAWIRRIRHSMRTLIPVYNSDRMVAEYATEYYRTSQQMIGTKSVIDNLAPREYLK